MRLLKGSLSSSINSTSSLTKERSRNLLPINWFVNSRGPLFATRVSNLTILLLTCIVAVYAILERRWYP